MNMLRILSAITLVMLTSLSMGQTFKHPGTMNTAENLAFMKSKVKANQQPWLKAYDALKNSKFGKLSYSHNAYSHVQCGSYNNPNVGCNNMVEDGIAAYSMALRWYIDGDKAYADRAIKIINDWSLEYRKNSESNTRLVVSWAAPWYVAAAEILRYTPGSGWATTNTNNFNDMLNRFKNYIFWEGRPNNNWMMSSVEARLAIAVFQNDRPAFNAAVNKWKLRVKTYIYVKSDGPVPINSPEVNSAQTKSIWKSSASQTDYADGHCMETCRDMNHLKLGFASLMNGAEIAWSQGEDVFTGEKVRLRKFLELHSNWLLGGNIPNNICDGSIDWKGSRQGAQEAFEIAYGHIHDRLGENLPKTKQMLDGNRPNSASRWVKKWETLCYANRSFSGNNNPNNPPTASWTQPILDAVPEGYTELYVLADASDPDGDAVSTVLKIDGNEIRPEVNAPYEWGKVGTENQDETIGLTVGPHLFEVIVTDSKGASTTISKTITVVEMRGPYLGSPISIPGTIEAEHYDKGGEGEAYHDIDPENKGAGEANFRSREGVDIGEGNGSQIIGWTSNGEWTEYTVDVMESTAYDFTIHYSANGTNAQFGIDLDGVELLSSTNLPTTGKWDSYQTSSQKSISLDAGQHIIRFKIINNGFNLDKVAVTKSIITGSSDIDLDRKINIYPNPSANGVFNMSINQPWVSFTIDGLEIARDEGSLINLSQLPKGMYLILADGKMSKVMIE